MNHKACGAVLISVLALVLILMLLLSAVAQTMTKRLELAEQLSDLTQKKLATNAMINELAFFVTTHRKTVAGISQAKLPYTGDPYKAVGDEVRIDGTAIETKKLSQQVTFSIQASSGLIPINSSDPFYLNQLLTRLDVSHLEINTMIERLYDYADGDDLIRAAGGEASVYKQSANSLHYSIAPPNFLLQNPQELWAVDQWAKVLNKFPEVTNVLSLGRTPRMNFNAIPAYLWEIMWPDSAHIVAANRENGNWFNSLTSINAVLPEMVLVNDEYKMLLSELSFIIVVESGSVSSRILLILGRDLKAPYKMYFL